MQNKNNQIVIWIIVILLVLVSIGWYVFHTENAMAPSQNQSQSATTTSSNSVGGNLLSTSTSQTASTTGGLGISYEGGGSASSSPVITVLSAVPPTNIPSLARQITFSTNMDATSQAAFKTQILSLEASLTKNPANFENWMQLGTDRKVIGDYQGAAQAWVYASELSPTDFVSPGNLADLYGYYLHDNALADTYYTAALHNGPSQDELYFNAASFYQQVENNLGKAVAVAQLGVKYNPGDQNLENLLTSLQTAASKTSAAN